jgi:hypothetical protein
MSLDAKQMRSIFDNTVIVRRPSYGIVKGYHELPYVCLGEAIESGFTTTRVRGKVMVSPQFVITPRQYGPSYEDIFGEDHVDADLTGRMFGIMGFRDRPVQCKSEYLEVEHLNTTIDQSLSDTLDDLERREDITAGVMICPNAQYYPVSIEKFISTILDDEFSF